MEFEDWGPVIARIEHDHWSSEEAVAKALSIILMGDDVDWRQHMTNAKRFIAAMQRSMPQCKFGEPPQPVDDGSCDPLYGKRTDSADVGEN